MIIQAYKRINCQLKFFQEAVLKIYSSVNIQTSQSR